jgi:hypothetical protein
MRDNSRARGGTWWMTAWVVALLTLALVVHAADDGVLTPAVTIDDLDLAACGSIYAGKLAAIDADHLARALDLRQVGD